MAIEVKISGTTYRAADDFIIRQQAGAVSLSTVSILKETNPIPQPLQAAQILIDGIPEFSGIIATVQDPPTSTGYEPRRYTLDIQSMEIIFTFRLVKRNWYNQRIDQIILDIFNDYIAEEGITLGGISTITEQIGAYRKTYSKVSEILDELAEKVGRASYYISPDKKFYFLIRDEFPTVAAPVHVTEITKSRSYGDLRTVQIVKGASAGITGTHTNTAIKDTIAALSGTSGKIENLKSDTSIRNPTAAALDAIATAEQHAEAEIALSCTCHDLGNTALYTEWEIAAGGDWPEGSAGYFVVVERTITQRGPGTLSIRVTLKNRNYFARYGYSIRVLATATAGNADQISDESSVDRLTPAKKIITRRDFLVAKNTVTALSAQAAALGITTEKTAYENAFHALGVYLNAGETWDGIALPAWLADEAMTFTEDITGSEYDAAWSTYYTTKTTLEEAIYARLGQQVAEEIRGSLPQCLGLYPYSYRESIPGANEADLAVLYSVTTSEQGIYKYTSGAWEKATAPTPDQVGRCFLYILSAVTATVRTDSAGNTISDAYGTSANYAPNSAAFDILLVNFLFARNITLQETGYLKSHDYTESSGLPTAGFMLDVANQIIKAYGAKFVSATIKDAAITNATVSGKATLAELILSGVTAGANIIKGYNDNVSRNIPNGALNTLVSYQICATGTIRAYINAKIVAGSDLVVHVVKNSTTVLELTSGYPDYSLSTSFAASDFSVDIAVNAGDIIHLKAQATPYSCSYKNFRICCAENPGILSYIGS